MLIIAKENDVVYIAQPLMDIGAYRMSKKNIINKDNCPQWHDKESGYNIACDGSSLFLSVLKSHPEILPKELSVQAVYDMKNKLKQILFDLNIAEGSCDYHNTPFVIEKDGVAYFSSDGRVISIASWYAFGYCGEIAMGSFMANKHECAINKIKLAVKDCCEVLGQGPSDILLIDTNSKKTKIISCK